MARRLTNVEKAARARFHGALRMHAGIPALVARELKVRRAEVIDMIERDPEAKRIIREIQTTLDDVALGHVIQGVNTGDKSMVRQYVRNRERDEKASPPAKTKFGRLTAAQVRALAACIA